MKKRARFFSVTTTSSTDWHIHICCGRYKSYKFSVWIFSCLIFDGWGKISTLGFFYARKSLCIIHCIEYYTWLCLFTDATSGTNKDAMRAARKWFAHYFWHRFAFSLQQGLNRNEFEIDLRILKGVKHFFWRIWMRKIYFYFEHKILWTFFLTQTSCFISESFNLTPWLILFNLQIC